MISAKGIIGLPLSPRKLVLVAISAWRGMKDPALFAEIACETNFKAGEGGRRPGELAEEYCGSVRSLKFEG